MAISPPAPVSAPDTALRIEALTPSLRPRQLRPCRGIWERHFHILLLENGQLELSAPEGRAPDEDAPSPGEALEAPAGLVLPPAPSIQLTLSAGTSGWLIGLAPELMGDVIGQGPEGQILLPSHRHWLIARDLPEGGAGSSLALAEAMAREAELARPGAALAISAWARLLILEIWRASPSEMLAEGHGSERQLIESFRREVELHYRSHLPISDYADRLGVSTSRLRRACQRSLARSPVQLVHQRLMREAGRWLEHSGKPISEIALALGFGDAPEFSHFFKRNAGLSPLRWREALRQRLETESSPAPSFADWP